MRMSIPHRSIKAVIALGLTTMLAACVTNEELGNPDGWEPILPEKDPAIAALVPDDIAQRGSITVGANTPYAPNQFKDSDGNIIGYEVDLIKAAGSVLGLDVNVRQMDFNLILPAISAGTLDAGASAFTDTEERQENYDFVDFFNFGSAWATQPGNEDNVDPANACGMTVAVQKGTYSDTDEVQGKSDECVAQGKEPIDKLVYATADAAANATILKRAEAYSSDSPVIAYAVERSDGRLVQAGDLFDEAQFGWAVDKGAPLGPALAAALQKMVEDGDYDRILEPWGLQEGAIDAVTFNLQPFTAPTSNTSSQPRIARRKKA